MDCDTPLAHQIDRFVTDAASRGMPVHEGEQGLLEQVLRLGYEALAKFLAMQGIGNQGESVTPPTGQQLRRLPDLHPRSYRLGLRELRISANRVLQPGKAENRTGAAGPAAGAHEEQLPVRPPDPSPDAGRRGALRQGAGASGAVGEGADCRRQPRTDEPADGWQMAGSVQEIRESRPAPSPTEEATILVTTADNKWIPSRRPDGQLPAGRRSRKGEKARRSRWPRLAVFYTLDPKHRTGQDVVDAPVDHLRARLSEASLHKRKPIAATASAEGVLDQPPPVAGIQAAPVRADGNA